MCARPDLGCKMENRPFGPPDNERAMNKALRRENKAAFREQISFITQPDFHFPRQVVGIIRIGPYEGKYLIAIVDMGLRRYSIGAFPIPHTIYRERTGNDLIAGK